MMKDPLIISCITEVARNIHSYLEHRLFHPVRHVDFMLTRACNLRCSYCFVYGEKRGHAPYAVIDRFLDILPRLTFGQKKCGITLMGGEPLLVFDRLKYFVESGGRRGLELSYSITTNGTLVTKEMLAFLRRNRIMLLLSLDGGKESHDRHRVDVSGKGSFELVANNIPLLLAYQGWTGARVTPTPETVGKLAADLAELYSLGIRQFIVGPATGINWREKSIRLFERLRNGMCP